MCRIQTTIAIFPTEYNSLSSRQAMIVWGITSGTEMHHQVMLSTKLPEKILRETA